MPKFSIILPVRNGGEYVKICINSMLAQICQDFNIIVLDNCSTDGTREWLMSLNTEKITIIPAEKPLTIEENWSRAKDIQTNEFITLIGHDDVLYPNFLENINQLIEQYPTASLYHTHFNFINANGDVIRSSQSMPAYLTANELVKGFLTRSIDTMGTGYVMRATEYIAVGGIPVKYPSLLFADFDLWLSIAAKGGIAISSEKCFAFRVHQSMTGTSSDDKLQQGLRLYVQFLKQFKNNHPAINNTIQQYGSEFLLSCCKSYSHRLLRTSADKRNGLTVKSIVNDITQMAKELGVEKDYHPQKDFSIKISLLIDSNNFSRSLFLLFKKLYKKPILKT